MAELVVAQPVRPRARDLGIKVGSLAPGPLDAITDVAGVRVGHTTLIRGDDVRTGVTAILPHAGNLFREKVAGAVFVGNAFGKLAGSTQVNELGEIETPIVLTSTLNVGAWPTRWWITCWRCPATKRVRSINPAGGGNQRRLSERHPRRGRWGAMKCSPRFAGRKGGAVEEGAVGAGTGTVALGFKGGIGTASRRVPAGYTVGVLVQTNFGGDADDRWARRSARELGRERPGAQQRPRIGHHGGGDGRAHRRPQSAAPGCARHARAWRAPGHQEATAAATTPSRSPLSHARELLDNDAMSPLFVAVIDATEEAIYNSLLRATTTTGRGHTVEALPIDKTIEILRRHGAVP